MLGKEVLGLLDDIFGSPQVKCSHGKEPMTIECHVIMPPKINSKVELDVKVPEEDPIDALLKDLERELVEAGVEDSQVYIDDDWCENCGMCDNEGDEYYPGIVEVMYREPATIVFWDDNTKTVAKCAPEDTYSKYVGLSICVLKKLIGNQEYAELLNDWDLDHISNSNSDD